MADFRLGSMVAEIAGEGPALVMVHGLGGSSNSFQPLMPGLGNFKVIRPDLPGAARSALQPGRPGLMALCRSLHDLIRACGVTSAHLVGHSMGTLLCQFLAAAEPKLVSSLTLYGPILEPPAAARAGLHDRAALARREGMASIAEAVSQGSLSSTTRRDNPAAVAFVRESLLRQDPAGYAAHCEALAEAQAADHGRIACPTLLVTGADDPVAPPEMARRLAGLIEDCEVEILPGCGHWPMVEAPSAALRLLGSRLTETTH